VSVAWTQAIPAMRDEKRLNKFRHHVLSNNVTLSLTVTRLCARHRRYHDATPALRNEYRSARQAPTEGHSLVGAQSLELFVSTGGVGFFAH